MATAQNPTFQRKWIFILSAGLNKKKMLLGTQQLNVNWSDTCLVVNVKVKANVLSCFSRSPRYKGNEWVIDGCKTLDKKVG